MNIYSACKNFRCRSIEFDEHFFNRVISSRRNKTVEFGWKILVDYAVNGKAVIVPVDCDAECQ